VNIKLPKATTTGAKVPVSALVKSFLLLLFSFSFSIFLVVAVTVAEDLCPGVDTEDLAGQSFSPVDLEVVALAPAVAAALEEEDLEDLAVAVVVAVVPVVAGK
jgi:hypothetical protein